MKRATTEVFHYNIGMLIAIKRINKANLYKTIQKVKLILLNQTFH